MNILLIPEDFRHDQYVLNPLFRKLFASIGKPYAKIRTCTDPLLGGISEAMKRDRLCEIFDQYNGMVDAYILCVDRDGREGRTTALKALESEFDNDNRNFFGVAAREEIEVWALAGLDDPSLKPFKQIAEDHHPKERFFDPYAASRGLNLSLGQGRQTLARESASNLSRLLSRCPQDLGELRDRLSERFGV